MTEFVAHTPNGNDEWHRLISHLQAVAERAGEFGKAFGARDVAWAAGLLHDLGKAHPEWQSFLRRVHAEGLDRPAARSIQRPDHRLGGAFLAAAAGASPVAFAVHGHHVRIPALADIRDVLRKSPPPAVTGIDSEFRARVEDAAMPKLGKDALPLFLSTSAREDLPLVIDCFTRFLTSALVDADFLDTEAHLNPDRARERPKTATLTDLWASYQEHHATFPTAEDPVSQVRTNLQKAAIAAAYDRPGWFRMTAPTGSGKTLASLAFALQHSIAHDLRRIIVAVPYTSITEQTADEYRRALDPSSAAAPNDFRVLEHHSGIESFDGDEGSDQILAARTARLATENWDAPVIVTTTVQLLESLFACKPSKLRKVHNVARSVLILDEFQALPQPLLEPTLAMLHELVENYGVSVLLCTATQPAVETVDGLLRGIPRGILREVAPDPSAAFHALRRVEYDFPQEPWTWERAAEELLAAGSAMAVVNTRKDALALTDAVKEHADVLHLSTLLCGAHRRAVLERVKSRLEAQQPCLLVTTQLVEAGVNLDFPTVLRAMGPLDRIVQAAGRCNREGRLGHAGRVIVFEPSDGGLPPGPYRSATDQTRSLLQNLGGVNMHDPQIYERVNMHDPQIYERYFRALYGVVDKDARGIRRLRMTLDFPAVADAYKLIPDDTVSIAVPYGGDGIARLHEARRAGWSRHAMRALQPFLISLPRNEVVRLEREGLLSRPEDQPVLEWTGAYDPLVGLGRKTINPSTMII